MQAMLQGASADMQPKPFEIPDQMRKAADQSVTEARKAFSQFVDATGKAMADAEGAARTLGESASDMSRQSLAFVEENVSRSFDLVQRLVQARTPQEIAALQQEYLQRQMAAITEQGKALGEMAGRAAAAAAPPKSRK
jgi:phasin